MTNPQPPVKGEPSDPMYVEFARIKLAMGDLYRDLADSLPRWLEPLARHLYKKAWTNYAEGYEVLRSWEHIKREIS